MIEELEVEPEAGADALGPAALLASIRSRKAAEDQAAADVLELAARWADLHPPESIHHAASFTVPGCEHEEPIAGPGTPLVAEFCVAELGTVLGITSVSAKKLIGHALELRHRLPRLWAQVHAGRVPAWRARAVAEVTIHSSPALTVEAAQFVDAQVAAVAGKIGPAQLDRLVAETIKRFDLAETDPAADPEDGYLHVDPRHVTIHDEDVHFAGTVRLEAEIDLADGLDLHQALAHGAAMQKALGSQESLDARRATALGDLARTQTALDLHVLLADRTGPSVRTGEERGSPPPRRARGRPARPLRRQPVRRHDGLRADGASRGGPAASPVGAAQVLVRRLPHEGHGQAGDRPQPGEVRAGLRGPGPHPRPRHPSRPHLRLPILWPASAGLRRRPRHRVRPRRRSRRQTPTRTDGHREPRCAVPVPPPPQDPLRLALRHGRARDLRVDVSARPPLPPRPHRHHRTRPTRPRPTTDPVATKMTPPHTPPPSVGGATGMSSRRCRP